MFQNPTRFYFGKRQLEHIGDELVGVKTVMIAHGESLAEGSVLYQRIVKVVEGVGASIVDYGGIASNPRFDQVEEAAQAANDAGVDFILGVGGGSVMDFVKAVSLVALQDKAWKKHWVRFEPIIVDPIPHGFVVTHAGTGSEGNGMAVIANGKTKAKAGKDYPELNARFAVLEPELTYSVGPEQTIAGAFDTLGNLLELYFSEPLGDIIADDLLETAMKRVMASLETALDNPADYHARANLMWVATLAGGGMLKCGKDGVFQCHMIERQISAYTDCAHGLGLAAILPKYYRFIKSTSVLVTFQLKRFAMNVWGVDPAGKDDITVAIEGIDAFEAWMDKVGAKRTLTDLGVTLDLVPKIARSTVILPMKYCKLNSDDIEILLEQCL